MTSPDLNGNRGSAYTTDTHSLWWYLNDSDRLSEPAAAIFRLGEAGLATIIVPAIVVAELYFLSVKLGEPLPPTRLIGMLEDLPGFTITDLGRQQLARLNVILDISEMHDRLIVAEAEINDIPLITLDPVITQSAHVTTIW